MENIKLEELGLEFFDFTPFQTQTIKESENDETPSLSFGPSSSQLNSFQNWQGCDGKYFFPYNLKAKLGKIQDFVTAAAVSAKEKEKEVEKNEALKRREAEKTEIVKEKKVTKTKTKEETKTVEFQQEEGDDDDMGFTTIEDQRSKQIRGPDARRGGHPVRPNKAAGFKDKVIADKRKEEVQTGSTFTKAKTKKDLTRQNFYLSNITKQLRCNLRDYSIDVKPEWELVKEFSKQNFDRLPMLIPVFIDAIKECGEISLYDNQWDKASGKKPKPIKAFEGHTFEESLFDDPVMVNLIEQNAADIFTTDVVIAALMCSTKSNYSWDIEIKKYENKIFIDKRQDNTENILSYPTVCETAVDYQPFDDSTINGIKPLMKEARKINETWLNISQNRNVATTIQLENENPFLEDENQIATRVGYKYKIWKLQDANEKDGRKERKICIRCSVHTHVGVQKENGEPQLMNVYALNEYSLNRTNWRNQIDNSIINCLNKEVTDNSFKVSRWLIQSMLAEVDLIKFAFISRKDVSDNKKHVLIATHTVQTKSWAQQMNISMNNLWPIVKYICEEVEQDSDQRAGAVKGQDSEGSIGEYILLKDFNKMTFRLYRKDGEEEDEEQDN